MEVFLVPERQSPTQLQTIGPYLESALGRAVAGALQHAEVCAPGADGLPILVGHDPGDLVQVG